MGKTVSENWTKFDSLFRSSAEKYGVPFEWLKAIALNESSLGTAKSVALGMQNPNDVAGSKSSDGKSWGLMQVTLSTAKGLDKNATEVKLNSPAYSIDLAAKYLKQLSTQFSRLDTRYVEWTIKSYNQGPGNTKKEQATGIGYADEYWARFQRNLEKVRDNA